MKKIFTLLFLAAFSISATAQTANWSTVLPASFPTNGSGQIHGISRCSQMKFHPTNSTKRYAVSARGGLFISTNSGLNWAVTPGTDFMATMRFASVAIHPTNDQIIYLGTGDRDYYYSGSGVMKSTDGGQTFTFANSGISSRLVLELIIDPQDPQKIVAATDNGIYKTVNGGTIWTLKSTSFAAADLELRTPVSRTMYATSTGHNFYRSTDFGDTWTQITSGIVLPTGVSNGLGARIAVTPADTNVVYLGLVANGGTIYKSTNSGTSFTAQKTTASPYLTYYDNVSTSSSQGDYNFAIGVDRNNANTLYLAAHNNWKSTDGGVTWTMLTIWYQKCHTDMHQIGTNPYNNNELYNINDGGVFLSTDGGNNWTPKSDGLYGYEIYHGNCSPTSKPTISIGTQDNGELYSNAANWITNRGGDWGSQCAFDYRPNSNMVYYFQNNKRRLVNGSDGTYGLPSTVTSLQDIAFTRKNTNLAFAAKSDIYRTTNLLAGTPSWTQISTINKTIRAAHSNINDADKLYVITSDAKLYVSTNAQAASPTFANYTIPNATSISGSITTVRSNPDVIYITANTKVYRSANGGSTWTDITYNLPSVNHERIIADEYSNNELVMIASGNTVYYKTQAATTWSIYSDFLPTRTDIVDMSIYNDSTSNTSLRVATYGRGMWETPIENLRATTANFVASNTNPCVGEAVTFSDVSTGTITSRLWTFQNGTPATSTAQNPVVTFNTSGSFDVTLTVTNASGSDTKTIANYISTIGAALPIAEGFEGTLDPPQGWQNVNNGSQSAVWTKNASVGGYGTSTSSMSFNNYSNNVPGEKDELIVKRFALDSINAAKLFFDVAYGPYAAGYEDSLKVLISTDCGVNFTPLYAKGGLGLGTIGGYSSASFVPTSSQWRTDTIDLSAYAGQLNVTLAFQNVNAYGNVLYIDNVNIDGVAADFTASNTNPCIGEAVTFTDKSKGSSLTRLWTFQNGTPATSTALNPVVTYNSAGSFNATLTVSNGSSSNIKVKNNYIVTTPTGSLPLAEGFEGTLDPPLNWKNVDNGTQGDKWQKTGQVSGYGTSTSCMFFNNYNWNIPNQKDELVVKRINMSGFTAVSLKLDLAYAQYGAGYDDSLNILVSTNCGASYTTVYAKGGPALSTISGYSSVNFYPSASQWRTDTVDLSAFAGQADVIIAFQNVNDYGNNLFIDNVNITGSNTTTCTSKPPLPGLVSQSGGILKICPNETRTFTIAPVATADSYEWVAPIGGVITSGQGTTSINVAFNSGYTSHAVLKVRAINSCGIGNFQNFKTTHNTVPLRPSVISGNDYGLCNLSPQAYSVSNIANATFNWDINDANAFISSGQGTNNVQLTYNNAFSYSTIKVNASNNCGSSIYRTKFVRTIPKKPTVINGATSVCAAQTKKYSTGSPFGTTSYTWTAPSGSTIADSFTSALNTLTTNQKVVDITFGTTSGNVKVRVNNACGSSNYLTKAVSVGCSPKTLTETETPQTFELTIVPNPATEKITLNYGLVTDGVVKVILYNVLGQEVSKKEQTGTQGIGNKMDLPVAELAAGVYQVVLQSGEQKMNGRFVKE